MRGVLRVRRPLPEGRRYSTELAWVSAVRELVPVPVLVLVLVPVEGRTRLVSIVPPEWLMTVSSAPLQAL